MSLEILFDYLDGLTELPTDDAIADGLDLSRAFIDALDPGRQTTGDYYRRQPRSEDCYLQALVAAVREALASLPALPATGDTLGRSAARCAEAQVRAHAAARGDAFQAEQWAREGAGDTVLGWREYLAGSASSVLAVHALIAAAADPRTTQAQARRIDSVYLPICVMPTLLDSAIDYEQDTRSDKPGFTRYYEDQHVLARRLAGVADHVVATAGTVPNGAYHLMLFVGVVAYYSSNPSADNGYAQPIVELLRERLRPAITPSMAVLHSWRVAKWAKSTVARWTAHGLQ